MRSDLQPLVDLLLALADDKLILGHRNSDWTGLGPILEEDIAFSSIAQDEIAHAQAIYEFISTMTNRDADAIAFGRAESEYRCAHIVQASDDFDWSVALARQLFCDHFDALRLDRLAHSSNQNLASLAKRLLAEEQVHVDHADSWIIRLGRGSSESHDRLQAALDRLAPAAAGLFEPVEGQESLESSGVYPVGEQDMHKQWCNAIETVVRNAGLRVQLQPYAAGTPAGRRGIHSEGFTSVLDEMCEVYRLEPDAAW
jgi:ring-1,2-phenylacetyl-CoA epoxidase subunit PaaC